MQREMQLVYQRSGFDKETDRMCYIGSGGLIACMSEDESIAILSFDSRGCADWLNARLFKLRWMV